LYDFKDYYSNTNGYISNNISINIWTGTYKEVEGGKLQCTAT